MNVRRGMFRLWVLFAVAFISMCFVLTFKSLREEFQASNAAWNDDPVLLPVQCTTARGISGRDYSARTYPGLKELSCWYSLEKFRENYPEYKDVAEDAVAQRLYQNIGIAVKSRPKPWQSLSTIAGIALGFPAAVFAIGAALLWAFAGFARDKPKNKLRSSI